MIRKSLVDAGVGQKATFRWRGGAVSRIEGLSDCVFGFAITLLVVSLEVPVSFAQLFSVMKGFLAFGVSFIILMQIWRCHYMFFRRYGLEDHFTISLNSVLLFLVVFFVYPMKFIFTIISGQIFGDPLPLNKGSEALSPFVREHMANILFTIYGAGFGLVYLIFALLYLYAYKKRTALSLNAMELMETRGEIWRTGGIAMVGFLSATTAWLPILNGDLPGYVYPLIGVVEAIHGAVVVKRLRLMRNAGTEESLTPTSDG